MSTRRPATRRTRPLAAARIRARRLFALSIAAAGLLLTAGSAQTAAAPGAGIEGIWSFSGGEVAIQRQPGGTLVGTVVAPTKFVECSHPDGEQMWTSMALQPDGSYWGLHQWYFQSPGCVANPQLGPTAWRVMEAPGGAHYLLVCFSSPGTTQPTISPSGTAQHATFGCRESARIAPLPVESTFAESVLLPSNRKCYSRRVFQIHLRDPKYDPLKEVLITLGHRRILVKRHRNVFVATVNLRGLPRGTFTVRIRVTTLLGHHLTGSRTYHTCVSRRAKRSGRGSSHG